MRGRNRFRTSRILGSILLATIVATGVFGSVFMAPEPAQAMIPVVDAPGDAALGVIAGSNVITAGNVSVQTGLGVKQSAWDVLKIALTNTAVLAVLNGANYFAQKIAYDTANYIASGGKGQKPLFSVDGIEGELTSAAQDAAGTVLGTLSQDPSTFGKFGINLCAPSDPRVALNIKLGFLSGLPGVLGNAGPNPPKPVCTWDSISNNWDQFANQDSSKVLNQVGVMFTPGQSSLSAAIEVNNAAIGLMNDKQQAAVNKFVANSGFKDLTDKISGKVKTPADVIKQEQGLTLAEGWKQGDKTVALSGSAIGSGAFAILPAMLQTFVGTLSQKLLSKVFKQGLISLNSLLGNETDTTLSFDAAPPIGGIASAQLANASLLTPKILSITNYNELTDFAACPPSNRGPNNCVMDGQFFTAVNHATQGAPLTVRQAIDQGFINRNWPLLPLAHSKNRDATCYAQAFCYSNLVKLRKASVLPIGWELAANSSFNDINDPVTLGQAIDRFNDCPTKPDGSIDNAKLPDPIHPWCHLVDPEWVLKYPETLCRQQAPGPMLVSPQSSARAQVCVDSASCISQDASGNCVGGYGYCVRDKNIWNMDADSCPAYYASCTTFNRVDGASFSFLSNTLDAGPCNAQNAGCRPYSQSQNAVPNPGFEDVFGGQPRDWTLDPLAKFSVSGLLAEHGSDAVGVMSGGSATAKVYSLLPGTQYVLSASVLQEIDSASPAHPAGTVTLKFLNSAGGAVGASVLTTTCAPLSGGSGVSLDVASTHLGYLSGSCTVTTPVDATQGTIVVSGNSPSSANRTWFDDVGLYGGSYSAAPKDTLFLNGKLQKCASDQAGCTDLVRMSTDTLNLVRNPGFEVPGTSGGPNYWNLSATAYENGTLKGFEGFSSVHLDPTGTSQDIYGLLGEAAYSFSVYSKLDGSTVGNPKASIQLFDNNQQPVVPTANAGCSIVASSMVLSLPAGQDFNRGVCTFTTPADVAYARLKLSADSGSDVLADAAQLELSVQPTAYHEGHSPGAQHVFLKVAPEGLNCTGPNRDASCDAYAPACRRDEVGCDSYTPVDTGGTSIPAVTTGSDSCPTECVGYDTFREEPSNFNDPRFPLFLIPASAVSCTAAESGCSEFTNVQKLAQGGESREYFSYLRLCAKPDNNAGTFYTWEGNDTKGYQLRTWPLLKSNVANSAAGASDPTGGNAPCVNLAYDSAGKPACNDTSASVAAASCVKSDVLFNPDCREFYDVAGNIHYRLYSKTIVINDSCTEYRITSSTQDECSAHGGFWRNGECHYFSYSPESQTCRQAASGCRAYSGNASRNVHVVSTDDFEDGTTGGWSAAPGGPATSDVVNSNESVTAGGHSLKVTRPSVVKDVAGSIVQGKSYILSFWAKGSGDLSSAFSSAGDQTFTFNRTSKSEVPISLGTEWKAYQVGPVSIVSSPASDPNDRSKDEQLAIKLSGSGSFVYLDNIQLNEISDDVYLIKDSWKTPASCDQTPAGDSSPQYMLGCRAYTNRLETQVSLKSFDRICRPEAVGCEALYDTHHTSSPFPQTFSAVCTLASSCVPAPGAVTCPCQISGQTVCQAISKATSCRYDSDSAVPTSNVSPDGDTVRVPADNVAYLVNDAKYSCDSANEGCTAMGDPTMTRERTAVQSWATVYGLNRPADYSNILCKKSEQYCQAYTRQADGSSAYFKQPELRTCEFKNDSTGSVGWFKSGTSEPCYPDFLQAGSQFGIWKNSDPKYDSWVGMCDAQYDMCKEFVDPQDTSDLHPAGQPYYAIMNDRLDSKTCQNQVSLTTSPSGADSASACVLFWQSDNLIKTYDASATYEASDAKHGALVQAVNDGGNDANIVIRVQRDRQCGEWLDCRSSETVFNQSSGQYQNVCTSFGLCAEYQTVGNSTRCARYVDSSYAGGTLTPKVYESRDTGWKGEEFTSYAIPNQYPINELITVNVGKNSSFPDLRLVRATGPCNTYGMACGPAGDQGTCLGPSNALRCVYPIDDAYKVSGPGADAQLKQSQSDSGYPGTSCRAYPDENAPFPSTVADPSGWNTQVSNLNDGNPVLIGPSKAFASANVCQRRLNKDGVEVSDCECSYLTAKYGSITKYFPAANSDVPSGYCDSGPYQDYECNPLASGVRAPANLSCCSTVSSDQNTPGFPSLPNQGCDDGSKCVRLSKIDREVGYEGQCLEHDFTQPINGRSDQYACLTWRPVGLIGGSRDIYNQNQSAGFFTAADRHFYCVGSQPAWALKFDIKPMGSDGHPDTSVPNGGPTSQDTNNYFGHGVVTNGNPKRAQSEHVTCEDNGQVPAGDWCVWPTDVSASYSVQSTGGHPSKSVQCATDADCASGYRCQAGADVSVGTCVNSNPDYSINPDAIGILGCYEVADEGNYKNTYIDYPYIGPALYRQQLQSIYFQMTNDIYRDGDNELNQPTNPHNYVKDDCNDDGDDSNIDTHGDTHAVIDDTDVTRTTVVSTTTAGVTTSKTVIADNLNHDKGLYFLDDSDNWEVDPSNGGGTILLTATFDTNGLLKNIRVSADDHNDSGTFGINRMGFVFKPGCSEVAQVDQPGEFGLTTGFTEAVNPARSFNPVVAGAGMTSPVLVTADGFTVDQVSNYGDACTPYGAIGATAQPPRTYVAARLAADVNQCTVLDFMKGETFQQQAPELLSSQLAPSSLRNLFRDIYGLWQYGKFQPDGSGGTYNLQFTGLPANSNGDLYDETALVDQTTINKRTGQSLDSSWEPPRVAAVNLKDCNGNGQCRAGRLNSMTINGFQLGTIPGGDGALAVTAKFFAWASHNAMPILQRTILWGDLAQIEPAAKGWYKNQKPFCSPDVSDANAIGECLDTPGLTCTADADCSGGGTCVKGVNHFGNTPGACSAAPFQFDHTYTCSLCELEALKDCTGPADAADNAPCRRVINNSPVCVYRPAAQIVDNWGWCNCTGPNCKVPGGAYGTGCAVENAPANAKPWTPYSGEIRLGPTVKDALDFKPGQVCTPAGSNSTSGSSSGGVYNGTAVNDVYTTVAGTTYGQHSLLDNDTLAPGSVNNRTVVVVSEPTHGTIPGITDPRGHFEITPEGSLNYVVNGFPSGPFYHGQDSFTYEIIQDGAVSNVATVTINNP